MVASNNATPLIALDAVVIDTETTSLDPAKAKIVEIAAIRLAGGRLDTGAPYRRLVRPSEPIPASATRIHGIDDAAVATAPGFAGVWPELSAFLGNSVVIGHTLGYDLAVVKHECEHAGLIWLQPRALDTRILAEICEPELPSYALEDLAAWLGTEVTDRHSALGDAVTCAQVFLAMLPKLRERNIRTLAEAERATQALSHVLDQHRRAGWMEPDVAPARSETESALSRIDTYPYRHRVREIMRPPQFIAADRPIRDALAQMMAAKISSLFVRSAQLQSEKFFAQESGIITERDLLRALSQRGSNVLDHPVEHFMSKPLAAVPADAFIYRAIGLMSRFQIRHLGAVDGSGLVVGALSARDLLRLRADDAIALGTELDLASDAHALAAAWAKTPKIAAALLAEEVSARGIAAVISREVGALMHQAAMITEQRMRAEGLGDPPCPFVVAVLGSAGRDESLLAMDQDNALCFAHGEPDSSEDRWFEKFGVYLNNILHEAGLPYCPGGVMAKNPQWRGSLATWQARIDHWIGRSNPHDLLSVDIFFDLRGVHGDAALANRLREQAYEAAAGQTAFAKLLIESAGAIESGLTFLRGIRTERGRINLKKTGLFGIVTAVRALAICHHVVERSTRERLNGIKSLQLGGEGDLDALVEAHGVFLEMILAQQIEDIEHGTPASNDVAIKRLSQREKTRLRQGLASVETLDELTRDLLFTS